MILFKTDMEVRNLLGAAGTMPAAESSRVIPKSGKDNEAAKKLSAATIKYAVEQASLADRCC